MPWPPVTHQDVQDEVGALRDAMAVVAAPTGTPATDLSSIQAAVTTAGVNGVVWFQPGTYLLDAAATPLNGQRWMGPGVLKGTTNNVTNVIAIDDKDDVTIDLTIDGGRTDTLDGWPGSGNVPVRNAINISGGSTNCTILGRISNVPGSAVRIFDSHRNTVTARIYNADTGVLIASGGSSANPAGGSDGNSVQGCVIQVCGYNGIFTTGRSDSGSNPNPITRTRITGCFIDRIGDTAIEVGQGSFDTVVSGVTIDGTGGTTWGTTTASGPFNGILVRDAERTSITGFTIRNFPAYTNGSASNLTLGNGIYAWPQFTGVISELVIANGVIENCTRGIFAQGQQGTAANNTNGNNTGTAGVNYSFCSVTNVVVDGTQLGKLDGTWTNNQTVISAHAFYIQSVSGWTLTGCTARAAQNDGFRIGDNNIASTYARDISVVGCKAYDSGVQAISGQIYSGFYVNGTSSQTNINLSGCRAYNTTASGSRTQHHAFRWNFLGGAGGRPTLTDCRGGSHSGTYLNGGAGSTYKDIGTDTYNAVGGSLSFQAGNYTVAEDVSTVVGTGTTGTPTITLPSATTAGLGRQVRVRNNGTVAMAVTATAGTVHKTTVAAGDVWTYFTDGTAWF